MEFLSWIKTNFITADDARKASRVSKEPNSRASKEPNEDAGALKEINLAIADATANGEFSVNYICSNRVDISGVKSLLILFGYRVSVDVHEKRELTISWN